MRIALLLVGHFRTFDMVSDTLIENVLKANPDHTFDIYIHTWKSLGYSCDRGLATDRDKEIHAKLTEKFGLSHHHDTNSGNIDIEKIKTLLNPREMIVETDKDLQREVYDKLRTPKDPVSFCPNTFSQFRKLYLCYKYCEMSQVKYDLIVKLRPDIRYTRPIIFTPMPPMSLVTQDHYVNDLFYYGPPDSMKLFVIYFPN